MTKDALIFLQKKIRDEWVSRERLGGFDANANTILSLYENMLLIVDHLIEKEAPPKKPKKKKAKK